MNKLIKSLQWIDENLIRFLLLGFIFIIPLYPKFPIRIIDYTYIAIRAEDFYIGFLVIIFLIQILRRKIELNMRFLKLFIIFWVAVFLSFAFNAFITKLVIYPHLGFLHAARRVEYMIVFFIASSTVKSRKDLIFYLNAVIAAFTLVALYALGQKFIGWPAVQTMNPEFAKGHLLRLTPEARVSSTFAGHYDLAAYLVLLLPMTLGLLFYYQKWLMYPILTMGIFVLTLTASRISAFVSYPISMLSYLVFTKKFKHLIIIVLITISCSFISKDLIQRVLKTVQIKQIFVNDKTGEVIVPQKITSKELPAGTAYIQISIAPNENQGQVDKLLKDKLLEEIRKEASQSNKILTSSEEAQLLATRSAGLTSTNTIVADISFATRLQVEWPRAVKAFLKNPILGTGPSSITESTDNDYLRWIGEFGAFGTGAFLYILFSIAWFIWKSIQKLPENEKLLYLGFLFGMFGLMLNASYIDVFEASKVAYTFWLIAGLFVGSIKHKAASKEKA